MGKQAALDRIVLGAIRRVVRDTDIQPEPVCQLL